MSDAKDLVPRGERVAQYSTRPFRSLLTHSASGVVTTSQKARVDSDSNENVADAVALPAPCLGDMPELVLNQIFSFLNPFELRRIELVNRRFYQISRQSLKLFRKIDLNIANYRLHDDTVDYPKLNW